MAEYKVLITTSGIGSRLGNLTEYTNKGLVRVGKKPSISYIIESYPQDVEFVVTLGHYGNHIKDFLTLAYPDLNFTFVEVENYNGPGSSLLYSMSLCKEELQCPFVFHACDTVVEKEDFGDLSTNWVAGYKEGSSFQYRTINVINDSLVKINDKGEEIFDYVYIGICGIRDYDLFWKYTDEILEETTASDLSDCHVISKMMGHHKFDVLSYKKWYDIGNVDSLKKTRNSIPDRFHLLDKDDESIYIFDDFVIKFFYDTQVCQNRINRLFALGEVTPEFLDSRANFYKYKYVEGEVYSREVNSKNFLLFLGWCKENLWERQDADISKLSEEFYFGKTHKRVSKYLSINGMEADTETTINSQKVPGIFDLLKLIDKDQIISKDAYRFHGDLVLENVIWNDGKYTLIDWRQDFGGDVSNGDIYYDLAKLKHNLTVNHDIIDKDLYTIDIDGTNINVDIMRSNEQCECVKVLEEFIDEIGLDNKKVDIIKSLIWINMAPLHKKPISDFLFHFGKYNLYLNT